MQTSLYDWGSHSLTNTNTVELWYLMHLLAQVFFTLSKNAYQILPSTNQISPVLSTMN
jgi:hypothetical protein